MINYGKYKNILVVGAGSGRDISNAIFVTEYLKQSGADRISLAGFLTPWALHYFDNKIEQPLNQKLVDSYKILANQKSDRLRTYFEYLLPELNNKFELGLEKIILFSLHWGYEKLEKSIRLFIKNNKFDLVILVDIGGDILGNEVVAKQIFTPFVDLVCLKIFKNIKGIDCSVFIMAPGVDGEISIDDQKRILKSYRKEYSISIKDYPNSLKKYYLVNNEINRLTSSRSGTGRMIKKIKNHREEFIYRKIYNLSGEKYRVKFPVVLEKEISSKIYIFNAKNFKRNNLINNFKSVYDAQISLRSKFCGSEVDMSFIPINMSRNGYRDYIFSLTPMDRLELGEREKLINDGMKLLGSEFEKILILKKDKALIKNPSDFIFLSQKKDFFIVTNCPHMRSVVGLVS